ncbi:RNA-directed DNA polymerase, eukaryota, reverse transcriptase zinc-binding domain protein [Tanacetum coccineum]|uniref:RNA-directed DNA polymerase, eukaryota, reverse transcriptase zinc-binding domain protein n=1 Tax=Tanacetum coccineum TaxID=301880 RepID=A0ABQ5G3X9_9ASTR
MCVLKDVFSRLYALERHQNVTIHTKLIDYSLVNSFRQNPRSGVEEFQLDNLSRLVSTITLSSAVDRYVWSLENSGEFSVKSIRQVIDANCFPVIHSATRWVKSVPLKEEELISELARLTLIIHLPRPSIGQLNIDVNEDTCTWSLGPNGTFTVKDARYRIDQNILPTLAHATTWDKSIPRKVNVFMWRLSLDRLPHRLNLSSRGMDIPAISCPSCNANVESANHVFFECDIATDMWKLVFRWCDIPLFQASSWDSFNDWIISWHASKEKKHRFYVITTSVLWWLWRYRNSVTFNSQPLRKSDLFDNVRFSSFSWLHNRDHMKLSWNDWLMYPLSIARNSNG